MTEILRPFVNGAVIALALEARCTDCVTFTMVRGAAKLPRERLAKALYIPMYNRRTYTEGDRTGGAPTLHLPRCVIANCERAALPR